MTATPKVAQGVAPLFSLSLCEVSLKLAVQLHELTSWCTPDVSFANDVLCSWGAEA